MKKKLFYFIFLLTLLYSEYGFSQSQSSFSSNTENEISVVTYPNPAKDYLYIKTNNPNIQIKNVSFYSILGNMVATMPINASYSEIRVDKLRPGKYILRYILSNNTQKIIQVIKQ